MSTIQPAFADPVLMPDCKTACHAAEETDACPYRGPALQGALDPRRVLDQQTTTRRMAGVYATELALVIDAVDLHRTVALDV